MKMDSTSSDRSPSSENASGSWTRYWEQETRSLSGINIGRSSELDDLMEDKEIASKAVAFVVKSTRRGIVPLCADVANLLREKHSLERKVEVLAHEVRFLRSTPPNRTMSTSPRTSHSASPTPPSP
ncbi:PREDICTED: uncharacterized protein LOC106809726, partial [Priapulus caudatus]|uniref:Uncharacterized protein LOC106809726 n=1 Tax=Priapulus caudatus TaxID=37621 RepID=A0ABM1E880_PRICU